MKNIIINDKEICYGTKIILGTKRQNEKIIINDLVSEWRYNDLVKLPKGQ